MTENEIAGWHHQLDRHEFEQAPGVGDGQESLVYCSSGSQRVRLNNSNLRKDPVSEPGAVFSPSRLSPWLEPQRASQECLSAGGDCHPV